MATARTLTQVHSSATLITRMSSLYQPKYSKSWALIIGIDKYHYASPLAHARADAEGVARVLRERFAFTESNLTLIIDEAATRQSILTAFMRYATDPSVSQDDRIFVFFAGHGHTVPGRRGETGFLVPVDGQIGELASLIRWDELTRNAELIPAKHVFFVMDACYGGPLLTRRAFRPGNTRVPK